MQLREILILGLFSLCITQGLSQVNPNLIPYRSGELWGYCTPDKKIVIKPKYEIAQWFQGGYAVVAGNCESDCYDSYDGKWGLIDEKGNEVLPLKYENLYNVKGKIYFQKGEDTFAELNPKGQEISQVPSSQFYKLEDSLQLPKNIIAVERDSYLGNNNFHGYKHTNGTTYWDDPETIFFFPIKIDRHDNNQLIIHVEDAEFTKMSSFFTEKQKPALVLLKNEDNEIKPVKYFSIEIDETKQVDGEVFFKVKDYQAIKPHISKINPNQASGEKIVLTCSATIPYEEIKQNVLFRIYQYGIRDMVWVHTSPYVLTKDYTKKYLLEAMVKEIHEMAKALKEQNDPQNQKVEGKDNPYAGKMLFDVMENATEQDVWTFLEYMAARPYIYMAQKWNFSEIFATWVVNGAPRVVRK